MNDHDDWTEVRYRRGRMAPRKRLNLGNDQSFYRSRPNSNDVAYRKGSANRFEYRSEYRSRPYWNRQYSNDVAYHQRSANRFDYRTRPYRNRPISNDAAYRNGSAYRSEYRTDFHRNRPISNDRTYRTGRKYRFDNRTRSYQNRNRNDQSAGQVRNSSRLTYAQVVKNRPLQKRNRQDSPVRSGENENRPPRMAATPKLRALAKPMVKLIKMVHHLQNVTNEETLPPTFIELEKYLSAIIKPAYNNDNTQDFLVGNAKNYVHTANEILKEHYRQGIEDTIRELIPLLGDDWPIAFEIAKRWARRQLGRRLRTDTLDDVRAIVTAEAPEITGENTSDNHGVNLIDIDCQTTPSIDRRANAREKDSTNRPQLPSTELNTLAGLQEQQTPSSKQPATTRTRSVEADIELRALTQEALRTDEAMPTDALEGAVAPDEVEDLNLHSDLDAMMQQTRSDEPATDGVMHDFNLTPHERPRRDTSPVLTCEMPTGNVTRTSVLQTPPLCTVNRHINTKRKGVDWRLTVKKKWLIIGDSNISRIPPYQIPDLQIESFPGALFFHADALIEEATGTGKAEKVVLAFGLNHRDHKPDTAIKQLQGAIRAAKKKWKQSEIWIPELNIPDTMSSEQKNTLTALNNYIKKNTSYIPALSHTDYVLTDAIHWNKETAKAVLDHWATHLNFIAE